MERKIKLFTSIAGQEEYHLKQMRQTSVRERFLQLYAMQQLTQAFHPVMDKQVASSSAIKYFEAKCLLAKHENNKYNLCLTPLY